MPDPLLVLTYDYVPDVLDRRPPLRPAHLELLERWKAEGRILLAGAVGDPPTGALIVFRDGEDAAGFARADPYVREGLVTAWRVAPWTVV